MTGQTPLLDTIDIPADIRRLKAEQLRQLADELRQETISAVSVTESVVWLTQASAASCPRALQRQRTDGDG